MQKAIAIMTQAIAEILRDSLPTIYLYGSAAMDDYREGWSDIDLLVLTGSRITQAQAERLVGLRQSLPLQHPGDPCFRAFEGGMLDLEAFLKRTPTTVVYWGTSGQRITDRHHFDSFSRWELHRIGQLLHGADVRQTIPIPTPQEMYADVARHLSTIVEHGHGSRSLYAFGWLLDIARGLYTLRYDAVASKTEAGTWALAQGLCPDADALRLALRVRQTPALIADEAILAQAEALTSAIQAFAGVLRRALAAKGLNLPC